MDEIGPGEFFQVAILAGHDEAHGYAWGTLASVTRMDVLVALPNQLTALNKRSAVAVLADEPPGKLQYLDAAVLARFMVVAQGRQPERILVADLATLLFKAAGDGVAQAWLGDHSSRFVVVAPEVQTADDDGIVNQVNHCAWAKRGCRLALPNLSVRFEVRVVGAAPPLVSHGLVLSSPGAGVRSRNVPMARHRAWT